MRTELQLTTAPEVPLEAECLSPDRLLGLSQAGIERLQVLHGNREARVGDFFKVAGNGQPVLQLSGDLSRVKYLGHRMTRGEVRIEGDAGMHLGAGMSGGLIHVSGDAADWVGPEMSGGRIVVRGDAGHMVGSAYRGQRVGIQGGEIFIHGSARNELGGAMRRGLIAVGGDAGDFAGVNLRAGTIVVLGECGIRPGAGMLRGSIVLMKPTELLPSFAYSSALRPVFLRFYLQHLRDCGFDIDDARFAGRYRRYCGDGIEENRGEVLMFDRR